MLWRKTYISTSRCENLSEDLAVILDVSRKRNVETGLTGVMLVSGGSFYQTLEGNRDEVTQTFFRIAAGDKPAYRTNVMAVEMDILITSFLSV